MIAAVCDVASAGGHVGEGIAIAGFWVGLGLWLGRRR